MRFLNPTHRTTIHHRARTIPVPGLGDDNGRFFKCWACGFECDRDQDNLGGPKDRNGVVLESYTVKYPNTDAALTGTEGLSADGQTPLQLVGDSGGVDTVGMAIGPDGTADTNQFYHLAPVVESGCPLCGSRNWLGLHR